MKHWILMGQSLSDEPMEELGGRTPLEVAKTPNMDAFAKEARMGMVSFIPHAVEVSPAAAIMSVLGYDPAEFYTGLAPLEARALGIKADDRELVFRCDFVTVSEEEMIDPVAGLISTKESAILLKELKSLEGKGLKILEGSGYKNFLLVDEAKLVDEWDELECAEPSLIRNEKYIKHFPKGKNAEPLALFMKKSREILEFHEINRVRIDLKENPANMLWLWGQGKNPKIPDFYTRSGKRGAVSSETDFVNGVGASAGLAVVKELEQAIERYDFVLGYFPSHSAPNKAMDFKEKIKHIEDFDHWIAKALKTASATDKIKVLITSDCFATVSKPVRAHGQMPFMICGSGSADPGIEEFSEKNAAQSKLTFADGHELLKYFIA